MKAIRVNKAGGHEVMEVTELPTPKPGPGELGVRDGVLIDNAFGAQVALAQAASIPVNTS